MLSRLLSSKLNWLLLLLPVILAALLWERARWVPKRLFHQGEVGALAFSPDGKTLVTATEHNLGKNNYSARITIWDTDAQHPQKSIKVDAGVHFLSFGNSGADFIASDYLKIYQFSPQGKQKRLLWQQNSGKDALQSVAISPDRTLLAAGGQTDYNFRTIPLKGRQKSIVADTQSQFTIGIAFAPDGNAVATVGIEGSTDAYLTIWQLHPLKRRTLNPTFYPHSASAACAYSPNSKLIAAGGGEQITVWDVRSGRNHRTVQDNASNSSFSPQICFLSDNRTLITANNTGMIKFWDVESGNLLRTLSGHQASVTALALSPDESLLASGSADGQVFLWRLQ